MKNIRKSVTSHDWDDEKVYFWNEENKKDWCVSDEEKLYNQLVQLCRIYFKEKVV